ncbi:MAG: hypothetical protein P1P89_22720 [Desulfobacterales bacterium]|nr:hypothetical protein [Desulfobacterales bacterium]
MDLPEYITVEEVQRVCKELGISDWTEPKEPKVSAEEAQVILSEVNVEGMKIDLDEFRQGLEVELEHGTVFKDVNVTNNHPVITGKIVLAHLKESLYYYKLLEVAEIEGDLLKDIAAGNISKLKSRYIKFSKARMVLGQEELDRLM